MSNARTLFECFNAKVKGDTLDCAKGYTLKEQPINILRLARGDRLQFKICQSCKSFSYMGEDLAKEDRGWLKIERKSKKGGKQ